MTEATTPPSLEVVHLDKSYGDAVALQDVDLEVRPGEVFGLLGPNGAGKTTLIRIVMDIIRADRGEVRIQGEPFRRAHLDRIGYLPEERGLYRKQTVGDVMAYFGTLRGLGRKEARDRAAEWLERVGLPQVLDWKVERLSKGMSQKVQIASTLMTDPEICILDEPFSGLDPVNLRLVRELIEERRQRNVTTILSTHMMNMVEALCDRVGLIHDGVLLAYGDVAALRAEHSVPAVRIGSRERPPEVDGIVELTRENGAWRATLAESTEPETVLGRLVSAGCPVREYERIVATMDDVFLAVVAKEVD